MTGAPPLGSRATLAARWPLARPQRNVAAENGPAAREAAQRRAPRDVTAMQPLAEQPLRRVRGYHTLVMRSTTDIPANYAVIAWTKARERVERLRLVPHDRTCVRMSP